VEVRGAKGNAASVRPVAYILDASKIEEPIQALAFDWEARPGTQVVKVRVGRRSRLERCPRATGWHVSPQAL